MPTQQLWLAENIYSTVWSSPLTGDELRDCFFDLAETINEGAGLLHILFDVQAAGFIPMNAPYYALKSGFMTCGNLGRVAVVGMDRRAQTLASTVVKITRRSIEFFPGYAEAYHYIRQLDAVD